MGYVTDMDGRLCCDSCGQSGGVRRRRCPVGYCQSAALCADCNANAKRTGLWQAAHAECPRLSAEYHAQLAREAAEPAFYPRAAWGDWAADVPKGMVKVLTQANTVVFLPTEVYRARGEHGGRLPDEYVAQAVPAEPDQPTTKQVVLA